MSSTTECAGMTTPATEARVSPPSDAGGFSPKLGAARSATLARSGSAAFLEDGNRAIARRNYITADDLVRELRAACQRETQHGFCKRTGANQATVSMVLNGIRPMTPAIANALGAMSETVYFKMGKADA
ncbi:MAG: hypothetical protein JWP29_1946 [Rhodoferax sp.]|nr:hypothetical protein [Rhodoferax sp.]